jgi:hypothetical protein
MNQEANYGQITVDKQTVVPCWIKGFQGKKRVAGIRKLCRETPNAFTDRNFFFAEGFDIFRLRATASNGRMSPSDNFSFPKGNVFKWIFES